MMPFETAFGASGQIRLVEFSPFTKKSVYSKGDLLLVPGEPCLKVWDGEKAAPLVFKVRPPCGASAKIH